MFELKYKFDEKQINPLTYTIIKIFYKNDTLDLKIILNNNSRKKTNPTIKHLQTFWHFNDF